MHRASAVSGRIALALAISTSVVTYFLLYFSAGNLGAWMILTIFVVMKPNRNSMILKTKDRILGTFAVTAIAIVAIEILHLLNSQQGLVQITFALLLSESPWSTLCQDHIRFM